MVVLVELITVLTRNGFDINRTRKAIAEIQSNKQCEIHTLHNEELLELALNNACQIRLKSLDYIIFLHYAKLKTEKFETFDIKLQKYIQIYQNNHEKH